MPRRYEEEINEILNKFDGDWPPPSDKRRARPKPRHANPQLTPHIGAEQVMVLGLALILAGVLLRFSFRLGVVAPAGIGAYATAIGVLLLVAGYVMAIVRGGIGGGGLGRSQHFWRGEVVDLRPSNRGLGYWWWRFRGSLRRR
jgi:hypothetical protein